MVSARLAEVMDLPSLFCGLVTITVRRLLAPSACARRVRSWRYCSEASDFGASPATSSELRRTL